ncbi:MAG: amidohydrolase family protein [Gammaproteobacteria bacterium]|nr:amidohydrolase family protein [Gammaproteobacteria bacterium]
MPGTEARRRAIAALLAGSAALTLSACLATGEPVAGSVRYATDPCAFTPWASAEARGTAGLVIGADVLMDAGVEQDHAVHVRFNGSIGATGAFEAIRAAYPDAGVLDCRGNAVLSPGFVNAHEHPAYSYAFPDANLNPGYAHRDEWRLGLAGKPRLPSPMPVYYTPGEDAAAALLIAMELRHLLGGATTIAGSGGIPGLIRNVGLHERVTDLALYDAEADVSTFPFSYTVVEDLQNECAGGPVHTFPNVDDDRLTFTAYVPHVGEGRRTSCAARAEVSRYLERVRRRDRRYSLVHGVAADMADYEVMRDHDVTLVWSPRSNLALYGQTVDLPAVLASGVRIALATDWSPSGSFNMREEVRCARQVASSARISVPDRLLWEMATGHGAYALGLEHRFGGIEPGRRADLILVEHGGDDRYGAVLEARPEDTLGTWIDGRPVLLTESMASALGLGRCEPLEGMKLTLCGVFDRFGLSSSDYHHLARAAVPLNDTARQAPCALDLPAASAGAKGTEPNAP